MSGDENRKMCSFDVCAKCCLICCQHANPPLTRSRQKKISTFLEEHQLHTKKTFAHEDYVYPESDLDGICVFFNKETHKCIVHPVKPETCKAGPITFDINYETRKVDFYLKMGEICGLAQVLNDNPKSLNEHLELAKSQIMQLIRELNFVELEAILKIPEPQTFKIAENDLPKEVVQKLRLLTS